MEAIAKPNAAILFLRLFKEILLVNGFSSTAEHHLPESWIQTLQL